MTIYSPSAPTSQPQHIIVVQRSGLLGTLLAGMGWLGFLGCGCLLLLTWAIALFQLEEGDALTSKFIDGNEYADDKIAVITIDGIISETEDEGYVMKQIRTVRK